MKIYDLLIEICFANGVIAMLHWAYAWTKDRLAGGLMFPMCLCALAN